MQRLALAQTADEWQSASEAAMHAASFIVHAPSSLQREDCLQSAADTAAHLPSFTPHLPSLVQALPFLQSSSVATHSPSRAVHSDCSLHASDFAQSSLDEATQRPFSAAQSPSFLQTLSDSGFSSVVPAQWSRDSATHWPPLSTHLPSLKHVLEH